MILGGLEGRGEHDGLRHTKDTTVISLCGVNYGQEIVQSQRNKTTNSFSASLFFLFPSFLGDNYEHLAGSFSIKYLFSVYLQLECKVGYV